MIEKINNTLLLALIICVCIVFVGAKHIKSLHRETTRLEGNISALLTDVEIYKTESGKSAAKVERLELTKRELEKNYQEVVALADELKVKVKRLELASATSTQTELAIQTVIKDTIIYRDREVLQGGVFSFEDSWAALRGNIEGNDIKMELRVRDTLKQIVYRVPRKFLFFRWGTKAVVQEVVTSSPYTRITYTEYLELEKRR